MKNQLKRRILRATVSATAVLAPLASVAAVAPATQAATVTAAQAGQGVAPATLEIGKETPNQDPSKTTWRELIKRYQAAGYDNVKEISAWSPSMQRNIPLVLIQPLDKAKRDNAPTLYLLNGADGGEGTANWLKQTDLITYYGGNSQPKNGPVGDGIGANIVIPMSGAFSYYTDWTTEPKTPQISGKQNWETFLTKELPAPLESQLHANGKRAIAGMSMTGTTSLAYAEHNPGFYDSVGSFSGCAATTTGLAPQFINMVLNRAGTNIDAMWGGSNTPAARYNDALLNADKLKGQENIYVSNGTGLPGAHDMLDDPRVRGDLSASGNVIIEGGVIEAATNACTHDLANKTNALNIPVTYNFRPTGTHQWGYWDDDLRSYWPVLVKGLGTGAVAPAEGPQKRLTPQEVLQGSLQAISSSK